LIAERYGLIGYPVSHSLSPAIFGAAFAALGMSASYDLYPIPPDHLAEGLKELLEGGVNGLNVTVPHKTAVVPLMRGLDESARLAGAVNTIVSGKSGVVGFNTDSGGFSDSLDALGVPDVMGGKVLVLGAGGAARAVGVSLAQRGASTIFLANRDPERARNLAAALQGHFSNLHLRVVGFGPEEIPAAAEGCVLCVQATSLGLMPGDPLPTDPAIFPRNCFLFDLVYGPKETPFVRRARELGYRAADGKEMLLRQGVRAFRLWFKREPPVEAMRGALFQVLGKKPMDQG